MPQQAVRKRIIFAIDITSQSICPVQYQNIYEKIMKKIIRDHKKNYLTPYLYHPISSSFKKYFKYKI